MELLTRYCLLRPLGGNAVGLMGHLSYLMTVMIITDCIDMSVRFEHHVVGYRGPTFLFISFQNFLFLLAVDCPWK